MWLSNESRTFVGMIELSTHIEYLLLNHDKVDVPQLGTFIVKEKSSRRIDEEGIFLPPYRTVSFQRNEFEEGEDFIVSLSKMHNLSRQAVRIMCIEYVDELLQTLEEDGIVPFGSMGSLLRNAETGEIGFLPQQSGIASPEYYGLDAVPFSKLSHQVRQQRAKRLAEKKTRLTSISADQDTITIRINRRAFNYATAVAASILLFFTFASPIENTISEIGHKAKAAFFSAPLQLPSLVVENKPEVPAKESVTEAPKEEALLQKSSQEEFPYAIVLASALSEKRALSYAAQLQEKGYNAQACMTGSMVRVIIPGFATEDEANDMIRKSKNECSDFSQAWLYRLKGDVKYLPTVLP